MILAVSILLMATLIGFPLITRRPKPVLAERFVLPTKTKIDSPLLSGGILFGIGWGLAGLCPGPALAGLASLSPQIMLFVAAMIAGQFIAIKAEPLIWK